jgi:Dolichyl-phosphate-mannose-protein mannosyltransferase
MKAWFIAAALAVAAIGAAVSDAAAQAAVDRQELVFGALVSGNQPPVVGPPQRVFVLATGPQGLPWTAVADRDWIQVEAAAGTTPSRLTITVRRDRLPPKDDEGRIVVTVGEAAAASRQTIRVLLRVVSGPRPPQGSFDAPADGTEVTGTTRFSGWALHEIGLVGVSICRDRMARSVPSDACGGDLTSIGEAEVLYNDRPDVAAAAGPQPYRHRSGWTFVLEPRALEKGALGTARFYAVARGIDGTRQVIGVRRLTIDPAAGAWYAFSPRSWRILALLAAGLVIHVLLRWFCAARILDTVAAAAPAPPVSRLELAAIGAIVGVPLVMNLRRLAGGLTYDELFTATYYTGAVPLWKAAVHVITFTNHIAYSLLAALSVRILGPTEFAMRFPAAILGALAVFAVWRYARRWAGPAVALAAAFVLATLPFHTHWSRMARGYTGMALMTVLAVHGFSTVIRTGSKRGAIEHAIALVLAVYFHLYAVFVFVVQYGLFTVLALMAAWRPAAAPLSRRGFQLLWLSFLGAGLVIVLLYGPVANGFLDALPLFAEPGSIRPGLFVHVFSAFSSAGSAGVRFGIAALVAGGAAYLWRRSPLDTIQLTALIVVPIALVVVVLRPQVELERYFGYWSPAFALFVAAGIWLVGSGFARLAPGLASLRAAATVVLLLLLGGYWLRPDALATTSEGYRPLLKPLNAAPALPVYAVGADAEMFQFYVDQWQGTLGLVGELEHMLLFDPPFRVAYHDVDWNSPEHRQMRDVLRQRCKGADRATVAIYDCGG